MINVYIAFLPSYTKGKVLLFTLSRDREALTFTNFRELKSTYYICQLIV